MKRLGAPPLMHSHGWVAVGTEPWDPKPVAPAAGSGPEGAAALGAHSPIVSQPNLDLPKQA